MLHPPPLLFFPWEASSFNPYFARRADSVSHDHLQQWPGGSSCIRRSKTTHTFTAHTHSGAVRCDHRDEPEAGGSLVFYHEEKLYHMAFPLIFQTAQGFQPATLTSSHKSVSLTSPDLSFPSFNYVFYSFPLTVSPSNLSLTPELFFLHFHSLYS